MQVSNNLLCRPVSSTSPVYDGLRPIHFCRQRHRISGIQKTHKHTFCSFASDLNLEPSRLHGILGPPCSLGPGGGLEPHKYGSSAALREALPKKLDSPLQLADEVLEESSEDAKGPDDVGLRSQAAQGVLDAAVVHSDAKSRDDVSSELLDASAVSLQTEEDSDLGDHKKLGKAGPEPDRAASHVAKRGRGPKRARNKSKGTVTMPSPAPDSQLTEAEELLALASCAAVLPEPVPDVERSVSQENSDKDTHSTEGYQAGACLPDATACLHRFWPHARAAGMTLLSTFLSLTFVVTITNIDPESYQPCNDESAAGCVYQKIFPTGNVDTTHGYFASVLNGHEKVMRMTILKS